MPAPSNPLPAKVTEALQRGNLIEAIKYLRDAKGLGLRQAKEAVEEVLRGNRAAPTPAVRNAPAISTVQPGMLPPSVIQAMQAGNTIEAIQRMREHTGLGLKEAKDAVDAYRAQSPWMQGGSPGEVPRSAGTVWLVLAIAAVVAAYYFLRGTNWV